MSLWKKNSGTLKAEIIIASPYPYLALLKWFIGSNKLPIHIASQDVSKFENGAYTGEVSASQLKDYATYAIVGHSERRNYFHETDEDIAKKVEQLERSGIIPIVCVSSTKTQIPGKQTIAAFEQIESIGTGLNMNPDDAAKAVKDLRVGNKNTSSILYGGSVNENNASSYLEKDEIGGLLIGGASLSASKFYEIITQNNS